MGREQHAPISPAALLRLVEQLAADQHAADLAGAGADLVELGIAQQAARRIVVDIAVAAQRLDGLQRHPGRLLGGEENRPGGVRSEEHTSELQSLMRISYAVFCLKKKKITTDRH